MLDSNNITIKEDILLNLCTDIIIENHKTDFSATYNDICIKMIDYLMF